MNYIQEYNGIDILDDSLTRTLFQQFISEVECDYIYIDSFNIDKIEKLIPEHNVVLIGIKDMFCINVAHDIYFDTNLYDGMFYGEYVLANFVKKHSQCHFVIFCEYYNPKKLQIYNIPNVDLIFWSSWLDNYNYRDLMPVCEKNFTSQCTTITLNRRMDMHRLMLVGVLRALDVSKNVYMSALTLDEKCDNSQNIMDLVDWTFSDETDYLKDNAIIGYCDLCKKRDLIIQQAYITLPDSNTVVHWDNKANFEKNLHLMYANSFVEIITETLFSFETGTVTEKYLNSVFGMNYPIMIATPNTVEYLRNEGFDMFDDVINHNYDGIDDPALRLQTAIVDNKHIILNHTDVALLWKEHRVRFMRNIQHFEIFLNKHTQYIKTQFSNVVHDI